MMGVHDSIVGLGVECNGEGDNSIHGRNAEDFRERNRVRGTEVGRFVASEQYRKE